MAVSGHSISVDLPTIHLNGKVFIYFTCMHYTFSMHIILFLNMYLRIRFYFIFEKTAKKDYIEYKILYEFLSFF